MTSAIAVEKIIGDKHDRLRRLLIRYYEPPKMPLYAPVAGETPPMNLFEL